MTHTRARCSREKAWHASCREMCSGRMNGVSPQSRSWAGRKPVSCGMGNRAVCGHSFLPACLPQATFSGQEQRPEPILYGHGVLSNLPSAGQCGPVTQHLCASPGHSPPTVADTQQGCPLSTSPHSYLYGRFLLELAFTHGH